MKSNKEQEGNLGQHTSAIFLQQQLKGKNQNKSSVGNNNGLIFGSRNFHQRLYFCLLHIRACT